LRVQASIRDAAIALATSAEGRGARVEFIEPPLDPDEQHEAWVEVYQAARMSGGNWPTVARAADRQALAFRAWERALRRHEVIILPPAMCVAFSHRPTGTPIDVDGRPVPYWGLARYAEPFNLTGHPAIVLPAGRDRDGLPIGVQVVAGLGRDGRLLRLAAWLGSLERPDAPPPN
jgi:amidase